MFDMLSRMGKPDTWSKVHDQCRVTEKPWNYGLYKQHEQSGHNWSLLWASGMQSGNVFDTVEIFVISTPSLEVTFL